MGAAGAADVAEEGAGHRLLPGQAGGPSAVLRAGHHRDPTAAGVPVGGGRHVTTPPGVAARRSGPMKAEQELLAGLESRGYTHAVIAFVDPQGYPMSVA